MARKPKPRSRKALKLLSFPYVIKSFSGYLQGTGKAAHTIASYRSDLLSFQAFSERESGRPPRHLDQMTLKDLERYGAFLEAQGYRVNTRRRKLLTIRRLFRYLRSRREIRADLGTRLPAPARIERIPRVVGIEKLLVAIRLMPEGDALTSRNKTLLWILAETGCQVSEVVRLTARDAGPADRKGLKIAGKRPREVPVSRDLGARLVGLASVPGSLFKGFNRYGPLHGSLTSRGVEMMVKELAGKLGFPGLTPRTIRHSTVVHWQAGGVAGDEIRRRLGLRSPTALRAYEPLFKSRSKATSSG